MSTNGLNTNIKLFMNDMSFFLIVRGIVASAEELNNDLNDINDINDKPTSLI